MVPTRTPTRSSVALGGNGQLSAPTDPGGTCSKDGARLKVKPSAARQTWTGRASLQGRATRGSFDIASARAAGSTAASSTWPGKAGPPICSCSPGIR
jgi:hypothetical protein